MTSASLTEQSDFPAIDFTPGRPPRLRLLDGFELVVDGQAVPVTANVQRFLAFLAISGRPQRRATVACSLWMDTTDERAAANLRTVLWRVRKLSPELVDGDAYLLALAHDTVTDRDLVISQVRRLLCGQGIVPADLDAAHLRGELLPMWDDDWVTFERERFHQLRIHGLEALTVRLAALGRFAEAVDVGLQAVAADPLRESAQRALIEAHLAEGNRSEAHRRLECYRDLLYEAIGVDPSPSLVQLVAGSASPFGAATTRP